MKILFLLSTLITTSAFALTIDEAGTQRVKKPALSIEIQVDSPRSLMNELRDLAKIAANNSNSVLAITIDADSDGVPETIHVHGDPHVDQKDGTRFTIVRKDSSANSLMVESAAEDSRDRDCCSGLASGKRQHLNLDLLQVGVEGANGGLSLSNIEESARVRRHIGNVKYQSFTLRLDNPSSDLLARVMKGWDGTVKGSSKRNSAVTISVVSERGRVLSQMKFKTKGSGSVKACDSSRLCGKTDHL